MMALKNTTALTALLCLALGACTPVPKDSAMDVIKDDYSQLYTSIVPETITLDQAVAIALNNNLDAKIAEQDYIVSLNDVTLQKFNALPTITAKRDFLKRNIDSASSSISAETGVISLEPSISSDRSSRVEALEANWQLLDAAINIYRSGSVKDEAKIARERYRKVVHNITFDTYSAFLRLAYLQQFEADIENLLENSETQLFKLSQIRQSGDLAFDQIDERQQAIFQLRDNLKALKKERSFADLELKALLSIPPEKNIRLNYDDALIDIAMSAKDAKHVSTYVNDALSSRPEIHEELLNLRIASRNVNSEILQSFPGLNLLVAANNDDNNFLEDSAWYNMTASVSQSITSLLTLPARYKKAKNEIELADARRKALVAAVIFQVNIAYNQYQDAYADFIEENKRFDITHAAHGRDLLKKETGLLSGLDGFTKTAQYTLDHIAVHSKLSEVLIAEARLTQNVGRNPNVTPHNKTAEKIQLSSLSPLQITKGGYDE